MRTYDGAEVCELVGTYMLNLLSKKYNKNNLGGYRDDRLTVLKNKSGPQSEQVKKNNQKIFKEHGLDIIIQCNMKVVNYLDVTFNLNDGTYKPYTKPNNEIKYIHKNSNHPASVIRQIPLSIESRLSTLSFNEEIFQEAVPPYQKTLQNSGYRHTLNYKRPKNDNNATNINKIKRNRKRQIIYKDTCPLPNRCQTKCIIYQLPTLTVTSLDINKNVTLAHLKRHLKIVSEIIKSRSTTLNIKKIRNYLKNFGKSKSAMEHQKLHGKLSEYAVLTIQTVNAAFYV